MRFKAIHCYSSVKFQGKSENYFVAKADMPDLQIEWLSNGAISVKTAKDHILVFTTNVAYALPIDGKSTDVRGGELLDTAPSTPRKK